MLNKNNLFLGLLAFSAAVIISSCGSSGESNTGQGGPDVSPDQYTDLNTPADDTVNSAITEETTPEEGSVIVTAVNSKIEGSLDAATGDTGLADAEEILDGALLASAASGTGTSTETATGTTGAGTSTETATGTSGTGTSTETATGTTGAGTSTETATGTSGTGTSTETAAGTSGTGTSTESATGTTGTGTSTETAIDTTGTESSTGTSSESAATTEPVVNGDVIDALEDDEAVSQTGVDYALDSSQGRWFNETKTELFSEKAVKEINAEIATLRNEIKAILDSYKKGDTNKEAGKVKIKQLREKIAALRARIGNGGRIQTGIYSNWAKENLYLDVKKGEPGWYRVIIVAKNRGKLPENYDRFTFSVSNSSNDSVAGISVKASDSVYYSGSADIKLENPSSTKLNVVWTNDAYQKDKYDANVSIKKVVLKKIKEPKTRTVNKKRLNGDKFSFMDGRWFFDDNAAYTHWANQVIGYTFKGLEEGVYEVTISARNYGSLPLDKKYKEFNVEVDSDYDSAIMNIKADEKSWNKEKVTMNFADGDTTLYITWTNDSYKEKEYDANIMIKSVSIKKVQKSSLTAFLLRTKPGNKVFILGAFLMLSGLIFGIYLKNKTSKDA